MFVFIITFVLMITVTVKNEPLWSRFDYDDLLEKMIRMEMKIEQILEEVTDKERNIMSIAADLSQRIGNVEHSAIQFQRDVNKKMKQFDNQLKEEKFKLTALAEESSSPVIAFDVRLSSTKTIAGRVVYDTEITNEGEGYDNSTGIFTAPFTGLYYFSVHVCSQVNRYVLYSIYREGSPMTNSTQYDGSGVQSCSSVSTAVMVNKADRVWVQCISKCVFYTDSYRWNKFSGFLVNK